MTPEPTAEQEQAEATAHQALATLNTHMEGLSLEPGMFGAPAPGSACELWARIAPVIDATAKTLDGVALLVPWAGRTAVVVRGLGSLLNQLCATA